jgi:lipoate-protein ligase A
MRFIYSNSSDASINLASEEYFLKNFTDDVFFLYINSPSIISGKHQNTMGEINFEYTQKNGIEVYRRLSGGGTVYHDLGNINFCFITNERSGDLVNFEKYLVNIVDFLATKGITAEIGSRHEITIGGKKISGNASHIFKTRVMHHGTLLFNSKLDVLNDCIKIVPQRYTDKAVKSVRSEVTNISEYLSEKITTSEFSKQLFEWLKRRFTNSHDYILTETDKQYIDDLNRTKFSTWNWIYGYSPQYLFEKEAKFGINDSINVKMQIEKGVISSISIESSSQKIKDIKTELEKKLTGRLHSKKEIESIIESQSELIAITGFSNDELVHLFF